MRYIALFAVVLVSADGPTPANKNNSPEVTRLFATKVQPVLMNACMSCHASPNAGKYSLRRVSPDKSASSATTEANLTATAAQIDRKYIERSPLLTKATSAHGGQRTPPIKDANAPAFRTLEHFARMVANDHPAPASNKSGSAAKAQPTDPFDPAIFNNMKR